MPATNKPKLRIWLIAILAIVIWIAVCLIVLGQVQLGFLAKLKPVESMADFGQATGVADGLLSSLALIVGLYAIVQQAQYNAEAARLTAHSNELNRINIKAARSARLKLLLKRLPGNSYLSLRRPKLADRTGR